MKFQRRQFLIFSSLVGLSSYIEAKNKTTFQKDFEKIKPLISEVQEHMFPENSKLPSAKKMHAITFLYETIIHKSYDKDMRIFILKGAEKLNKRTKGKFLTMTISNKEQALRDYEETKYGSSWLSYLMVLTMEGMLSDPIYGSNIQQTGWKSLKTSGGEPRPLKKYLDV